MDNPLSPPQFYNTVRARTLELTRTVEGEPMKAGGRCTFVFSVDELGNIRLTRSDRYEYGGLHMKLTPSGIVCLPSYATVSRPVPTQLQLPTP